MYINTCIKVEFLITTNDTKLYVICIQARLHVVAVGLGYMRYSKDRLFEPTIKLIIFKLYIYLYLFYKVRQHTMCPTPLSRKGRKRKTTIIIFFNHLIVLFLCPWYLKFYIRVNNDVQTSDKYNDANMLKRKLACDKSKKSKKRKRNNSVDLLVNGTTHDGSTEKFDEGLDQESLENTPIEHEKLLNGDNSGEENEGVEKDTSKQTDHLTGKFLRESFSSTKDIDVLKKFVKVCNEDKERDLAAEYLNEGGNILEILKLLDDGDKKGISTATAVFSAVRILLMKILTQYPQYQSSAEAACRHLINSHLSLIHSMLSLQSNAKQRRVILQLLAVVVSLGGNLPRELLAHLSLPLEVVKFLVQHTKPTDSQNTRNCFIHFILAFLVEGSVPIIRVLLDKRILLSSIFPALIYDSKDIVTLVLTTLKTYILHNASVSKTMKLKIFSTSIIQNLVCLYNWKGPNNWPKLKSQDAIPNVCHLQEKEVVIETVHDFLITLLTSHKHGIIFHDRMLGTSHVKHNRMVNTILQSLDRPWEHEKPSDLVVKILTVCPDLIKSQFILLEPYIEPRLSPKWIATMKFAREIIKSVDVETCIRTCSGELSISQLTVVIISLTLPRVILKQGITPALVHSNIIIRHEAMLTLTSMFNQIQKHLSVVKTVYKGDNNFYLFKNYITEFMLKNVPNLNIILEVWGNTFISDLDEDSSNNNELMELDKNEHLTVILELLHMYNDVCPKLLDTLPNMQADTFLNILNKLDDTNVEFNAIKVKAIKFLVKLHPDEFLPHKKIFKDTLSFLISILNEETSSITLSTKATIKSLLNATGMFEGCSDQLDIWINGFISLDNRKKVTKWFIRIIKEAVQNVERYVNDIINVEEIINQEVVHIDRLESIFNELANMPNIHENLESTLPMNTLPMQRFTAISPLLCCILHRMKEELHSSILCYMSYVLIHTLHCQVTPECLIHFIKNIPDVPVKDYLLSWLEGSKSVDMTKIIPSMTLMCELNAVFFSDSKLQMNEIFYGDNTVTFRYNEEVITIHHSLSAYEIICLFKMTIFYFTQFIKRGILTRIQYENYQVMLISLLYLASDNVDNSILVQECIKHIFTHPTILHNFSPFYQKSEDVTKSMLTFTIVDICKVAADLCKECSIQNFFTHFKNKLFTQLCKMMDKKQKSKKINNTDTIITLLELLRLTSTDIVHLLKRLVKLEYDMFISNDEKNLSIYGHTVPKLLKMINSKEMKRERNVFFELDAEFIRAICSHLLFLKSSAVTNLEIWETALYEYLSNFSFNISGIDANIVASLISMEMTDTTVKLISFLISKNIKFIPVFTECMMKSNDIKKGNIVLPIVASNLNFKWSQEFLKSLRTHFKAEILSYLCDPKCMKLWIEENTSVICYLIKTTFDLKACNETCNSILQIGDKLDKVSINYIKLLQSVYNKCATHGGNMESDKFIMNLIHVLLHIITLTLKRESKNVQKLNILCDALDDAVKRLRSLGESIVFEALSRNYSWSQFTRFSLKYGLKELKSDEARVPMLRTLSILCDIAYKNESNDEYAKTLFEMATSHSEFINIMLGSSDTKRDLLELLWILMQKNKTVVTLTHVPVYLAAYNATLSESDQYILIILQYYERNGINICEYRPYVWGNTAAIHYSVKGEMDTTLWRQPSIAQVLNLFEEDVIMNTIKHYPVDRALKNTELFKANDIYDPAFYLPLLCFLLSENNVVSCHKVAQSGALALTLAACCSKHSDVRMVAYTVIARYYTHLEATSSKARLLWMRLIDAIRYGIISLQSELNNVRLNCLVTTFLARTSLIATQPLHRLYSALQTFLMAKPALDVNTIPELLQFLHNSDVQYKAHRYWILENIRDGMKTECELDIAFKCVLFKMLLSFYVCSLSDSTTKELILEIIAVTLEITKAGLFLIEGHGLFPWLLEVTENLHKHKVQHAKLVVRIMDKLLNTILSIKGDVVHYKSMLLNVALRLNLNLVKNVGLDTFMLYVNILQKLLLTKQMKVIFTKEHLMRILEFSKELLDDIEDCDDMLRFGCEYVTKVDYSKNNKFEVTKNSLRTLVWTWCSHEIK
ncbi:nucleolar pre-ribosomal-associated protein 1 [Xylocopa sonorina]|uniref:nucleolar pre-ribosomal-associated protein 1 n=1 Tax=Xylocopa sonorina TaxID=1818115 RepID=UPI00403B3086